MYLVIKSSFGKLLVLTLILSVTIGVQPAPADSSPLIKFNGRVVSSDVDPTIVNSRVLVPLRLISEEIGYSVHWDSDIQTVFVNGIKTNKPDAFLESTNEIRLIINGQTVTGDVAPCIIHNRVMVPVRIISPPSIALILPVIHVSKSSGVPSGG